MSRYSSLPRSVIAPAARRPLRRAVGQAVGALVTFAAIAAIAQSAAPPPTIDRIAFVNPTAYDLSIDVTTARRDGWTPVVIASRHHATIAREVVDQGDTWTFRFEAQGERGGELTIRRRVLEHDHWVVPIPETVAERLEDDGATPPP